MTRLAAIAIAFALGLAGCVSSGPERVAVCESLGAGYGSPDFGPCMRQQDAIQNMQSNAAAAVAGEIVSAALGQAIVNTYYPPPPYYGSNVIVWRHSGGFHR